MRESPFKKSRCPLPVAEVAAAVQPDELHRARAGNGFTSPEAAGRPALRGAPGHRLGDHATAMRSRPTRSTGIGPARPARPSGTHRCPLRPRNASGAPAVNPSFHPGTGTSGPSRRSTGHQRVPEPPAGDGLLPEALGVGVGVGPAPVPRPLHPQLDEPPRNNSRFSRPRASRCAFGPPFRPSWRAAYRPRRNSQHSALVLGVLAHPRDALLALLELALEVEVTCSRGSPGAGPPPLPSGK